MGYADEGLCQLLLANSGRDGAATTLLVSSEKQQRI